MKDRYEKREGNYKAFLNQILVICSEEFSSTILANFSNNNDDRIQKAIRNYRRANKNTIKDEDEVNYDHLRKDDKNLQ